MKNIQSKCCSNMYTYIIGHYNASVISALRKCYRVTDILGNICTEWAKPLPLLSLRGRGGNTVCECERWQSYRSALTSITGTITGASIVIIGL